MNMQSKPRHFLLKKAKVEKDRLINSKIIKKTQPLGHLVVLQKTSPLAYTRRTDAPIMRQKRQKTRVDTSDVL